MASLRPKFLSSAGNPKVADSPPPSFFFILHAAGTSPLPRTIILSFVFTTSSSEFDAPPRPPILPTKPSFPSNPTLPTSTTTPSFVTSTLPSSEG
ncbi:hypothetical protein DEO72_LG3g1178 [Vigna unguiculata]|uniref:Uncharacterized protein n=1 Tax=Vigna unguiculata TaxID=3917 RepID=A0A4D6LEG3_VIGUN|nr:hypothetical protein DEO72_LG3g1178 [Vigna unguiculata]